MDPTELCWENGEYNSDCNCDFCEHKSECSGYEDHDSFEENIEEQTDNEK